MSLVVIADLVTRLNFLEAFYTDLGTLPRAALIDNFSGVYQFSIHLINGSTSFQLFLFILNIIFALLLLVGYKARWMSFLCWLFCVSVQNRHPAILNGGDVVLRMLLFWSMFIPLGLTYSVESALNTIKNKPRKYFSAASIGLLLQVVYIYVFTAIFKDHPDWYPNGSAIRYALSLERFATPYGIYLLNFPEFLKSLSLFTYFLEMFGAVLLFIPFQFAFFRLMGVVSFWGLHFGIFLTMNLGVFPWVCMAAWCAFLPGVIWDDYSTNFVAIFSSHRGRGFVLYFDKECSFCKKMVYLLREFLILDQMEVLEAQEKPEVESLMQEHHSWILKIDNQKVYSQYDVFLELLKASFFRVVTYPIFALAPMRFIGQKAYKWVSHNRNKVSPFFKWLHWSEQKMKVGLVTTALSIFFSLFILLYNLQGIQWKSAWLEKNIKIPSFAWKISDVLRVDQKWDMFSPMPSREDGWYVMEGESFSGARVNLWTTPLSAIFHKPQNISDSYIDQRWRKYLDNLWLNSHKRYRPYLARYLCRSYSKGRHHSERIKSLKIHFMLEPTVFDIEPRAALKRTVLEYDCFKR